jgi:hypothetical protein
MATTLTRSSAAKTELGDPAAVAGARMMKQGVAKGVGVRSLPLLLPVSQDPPEGIPVGVTPAP